MTPNGGSTASGNKPTVIIRVEPKLLDSLLKEADEEEDDVDVAVKAKKRSASSSCEEDSGNEAENKNIKRQKTDTTAATQPNSDSSTSKTVSIDNAISSNSADALPTASPAQKCDSVANEAVAVHVSSTEMANK